MAPTKHKHNKKNQIANVPEVVSEAEPSSSYEKSKANDNDNLQNNNEDLLNILDKLIKCLKSEDMNMHISILKSLLNVAELEEKKRKTSQNLICTFLNNLEQCDVEELGLIANKFEDIFIPTELRKLMTKDTHLFELGVLGEGSCGIVYEGLLCQEEKQKKVAIKVSKDDQFLSKMLKNEAKVMCQLKHPNIVQILAVQKNPLKIAMEHMNMGNLSFVLKVEHLTNRMLLKVVHDIASGMEYLAKNNFVHRDLKINNIFVDKDTDMVCKIGDFGTCRYVGHTGGVYHEKELTLTQFHIPPEAKRTQTFSVKSDVYAMGTLIWNLYIVAANQKPTVSGLPLFIALMSPLEIIFGQFNNTGKLEKPIRMTDTFFRFVKTKILSLNPGTRPSFTKIKEEITKRM